MTVPVVDLRPWFDGTADGRAAVAAQVDDAFRESGFLLVTGYAEVSGRRHHGRVVVLPGYSVASSLVTEVAEWKRHNNGHS